MISTMFVFDGSLKRGSLLVFVLCQSSTGLSLSMKVGDLEPKPLEEKNRLDPAVWSSLTTWAIASLFFDVEVDNLYARSVRRASRLFMASELGSVSISKAVWSAMAWCQPAIALLIESFSSFNSSVADSKMQPMSDLRVSHSFRISCVGVVGSINAVFALVISSLMRSIVAGMCSTPLLILLYPGPQSRFLRLRMVRLTAKWSEKKGGRKSMSISEVNLDLEW